MIISQSRLATMEKARATLRSIQRRWAAKRPCRTARKPARVVPNHSTASSVFATCPLGPCRVIGLMIITQTAAGSAAAT